MHPGRLPARRLLFPRPQAHLPAPVASPPDTSGMLLRRGQHTRRHPSRRWRFPRRPRAYVTYGGGGGAISGVGPVGATTLVLSLQPGTKVIYGWSTAIYTSENGAEQRESAYGTPRRRLEGNAFLVDAGSRDARGAMQRGAASGATFMLALPFEAMTITADSPASTVSVPITVASTATCDWALPGQRVTIAGATATVNAVIQTVTATTITVVTVDAGWNLSFATLGTAGKAGGLIMPTVPVLLDPAQGFARYPTRVDLWTLRAQVLGFGFAGVDSMGVGATLVTYSAGTAIPVASVTEADLLIWDRPNAIEGTATESMLSRSETVDLGALPFGIGDMTVPVWGRSLKLRTTARADWAWFKAFVRHTRGRQGAFLLSTNRPDLVFVASTGGGIKVASSSVSGGGDYTSWYASAAHRRLAILGADGTITYATVTAAPVDNGDGTLTLTLDASVVGTVTKISFLEQVRFDRDDIEVTWSGATFSIDETVLAVQESIITLPLLMFDTVINLAFVWGGTLPPSANEFTLTLGKSTFVNMTTDRTMNVGGLSIAGAGPLDGQILCLKNGGATGVLVNFVSEDTAWPDSHRMAFGAGAGNGTGSCFWFVFNAAANRWLNIMVA